MVNFVRKRIRQPTYIAILRRICKDEEYNGKMRIDANFGLQCILLRFTLQYNDYLHSVGCLALLTAA